MRQRKSGILDVVRRLRSVPSNHVPVDYTWVKYVVKRRGVGFVHYTHQKTLTVEPKIRQTEAESLDMYEIESS